MKNCIQESLRLYLPALRRWWWVLVIDIIASGVAFGLIFVPQFSFPVWAWLSVAVVGFMIAQFLVYHDTRVERDMHQAKVDALKDTSHQLARFIVEGQQQVDDIYNGVGDIVQKGEVFRDWEAKAHTFLEANIPLLLSSFELELSDGLGGGLKEKMRYKVERLRYTKEWFDEGPTL